MAAKHRLEMGRAIVEFEGRYKEGKLTVYNLPPGDGGGAFEIAGINERYHREMASQLKQLIESGQADEAERAAAAYIEKYTRPVVQFFSSPEAAEDHPDIEFILRDSAFNRGLKGAATILQIALGLDVDGVVGPATRSAFGSALADPLFAAALTKAREIYERNTYPWKSAKRDEASKFWRGLANRWAKSHEVATTRFV